MIEKLLAALPRFLVLGFLIELPLLAFGWVSLSCPQPAAK